MLQPDFRVVEAAIACVKLWYFLIFCIQGPPFTAFRDDIVPDWLEAVPFLVAGTAQISGLRLCLTLSTAHIGYRLRVIGAWTGMCIWLYVAAKCLIIGHVGGLMPWVAFGICVNILIVRAAAMDRQHVRVEPHR